MALGFLFCIILALSRSTQTPDDACTINGIECSNNGLCEVRDGQKIGCVCKEGYYNAGQGLCYDLACRTGTSICSNGGACVAKDDGGMECMCDLLHTGVHCNICNARTAMVLKGQCVPLSCIMAHPHNASLSQICGGGGQPVLLDDGHYSCNCTKPDYREINGLCVHKACISQSGQMCSGNGVCLDKKCICYSGFSGPLCKTGAIFCDEGYTRIGSECFPDECLSRGLVCGSNGKCIDGKRPKCLCNPGFKTVGTELCAPESCIKDEAVCLNGNCVYMEGSGTYGCVCWPGYIQSLDGTCISQVCISSVSTDEIVLCNNRGNCVNNTCVCSNNFGGSKCQECGPGFMLIKADEAKHDQCVSVNCLTYATSNITQQAVHLHSVESPADTPLLICDGFGTCEHHASVASKSYFDYKCRCNPGAIAYKNRCYSTFCFSASAPNTVCSGHGYCRSGTCICDSGHGGTSCENNLISCPFGTVDVSGSCIPEACVANGTVCSGLGECIDTALFNETSGLPVYECACRNDFRFIIGHGCVHVTCINTKTNTVCENGKCISGTKGHFCKCDPGFVDVEAEDQEGNVCISSSCITSGRSVCNNYAGKCVKSTSTTSLTDYTYYCACEPAYTGTHCEQCSSQAVAINGRCYPLECLSPVSAQNLSLIICGGHGSCSYQPVDDNAGKFEYVCACDQDTVIVNGTCTKQACVNPTNPDSICSGSGYCNARGVCECDPVAKGRYCETLSLKCLPDETIAEGACVPNACVSTFPALSICGGNGKCSKIQKDFMCVCNAGFTLIAGMNQEKRYGCVPKECIVSGVYCPYGECAKSSDAHFCRCSRGFQLVGDRCIPKACTGTAKNGTLAECSGHGGCMMDVDGATHPLHSSESYVAMLARSADKPEPTFRCACRELYIGDLCFDCTPGSTATSDGHCTPETCLTVGKDNVTTECNGAGVCTKIIGKWQCSCTYPGTTPEKTCQPATCFGGNNTMACSSHGVCHKDGCVCNAGFTGPTCNETIKLDGGIHKDAIIQPPQHPSEKPVKKRQPPKKVQHEAAKAKSDTNVTHQNTTTEIKNGAPAINVSTTNKTQDTLAIINVNSSEKACKKGTTAFNGLCYPSECITSGALCGNTVIYDKSVRQGTNSSARTVQGFTANVTSSLLCQLNTATKVHQCVCIPPFRHIYGYGCVHTQCLTGDEICPNGTCLLVNGSYSCQCQQGFQFISGTCVHDNCVKQGLACSQTPDANSGTCVQESQGEWKCQCSPGYAGRHCSICDTNMVRIGNLCAPHTLVRTYSNGTRLICGGSGRFVGINNATFACQCDYNATPFGRICVHKQCLNFEKRNSQCTGHGECYRDKCICSDGYYGALCNYRLRNFRYISGFTITSSTFFAVLFAVIARCARA